MQQIGPFILNGFHFLAGGITLLLVMIWRMKSAPGVPGDLKSILLIGSAAGLLLFLVQLFNSWGWFILLRAKPVLSPACM
jgi:hypothetical protein